MAGASKGNLHAHVAAADHNARAFLADILQIVDAGPVFDFSDEIDVGRVIGP